VNQRLRFPDLRSPNKETLKPTTISQLLEGIAVASPRKNTRLQLRPYGGTPRRL